MDRSPTLTLISLCAGYGGIDLGLKRALGAVRTVAFSEIESYACANLVAKMEAGLLDSAPIWTDLKTFPWSEFRGKVDILSGGFPCQPFSSAGRRAGDDDPRHLFPYILRGLRELGRPALVFLENVEGILSAKLNGTEWADPQGTHVLLHVLRELERVGYQATAGVFSASETGAPHQRKRVFILGVRDDLGAEGRALVSRLLADTGAGGEMGNTEHYGHATSAHARGATPTLDAGSASGTHGEREPAGAGVRVPLAGAHVYPAGRGAAQHAWEPPRVTEREPHGATQPTLGGDAHGAPCGLDYGVLCRSVDNRTDELRLLGNGVVPATAERAFRVLWERVGHAPRGHS